MKTKFWTTLVFTALTCLRAYPTLAQEDLPPQLAQTAAQAEAVNIERIAHLGGESEAVAVQGNFAYLGEGPTLAILDITNPASPTHFSEIGLGSHFRTPVAWSNSIDDIALAGNHAYVVGGKGLHIVDIAVPSAPLVVGSYFLPEEWMSIESVSIAEQYAYLACGSEMYILDISNPTQPVEISVYDTQSAVDVTLDDAGHAYIVQRNRIALQIVDVSNPEQPVQLSTFSTLHEPNEIAVSGNYAYMVGSYLGLITIDVSNPVSPTHVHSYGTGGQALRLALLDGGIAVGTSEDLQIFSLSNPAAPERLATAPIPRTSCRDMFASGHTVYSVHNATDLQIIDVSTLNQPVQIGVYYSLNHPWTVTISGDYAYVGEMGTTAEPNPGMRIVDISNPATPHTVRAIRNINRPTIIQGNYGYGDNAVIDISIPLSPTVVAHLPGDIMGISGIYAYALHYDLDVMYVVDISDPTAPATVSTISLNTGNSSTLVEDDTYHNQRHKSGTTGTATVMSYPTIPNNVTMANRTFSFALYGDYAYVIDATFPYNLHIINVSDPTTPVEVATYEALGHPHIAVSNNYLFWLKWYDGLHIFDISDPLQPIELSFLAIDGDQFHIADQLVYISTDYDGIHIIDVAALEHPVEVGTYTPCDAGGLALNRGYIFANCGEIGMEILKYTGIAPAGITLTGPITGVQRGTPTVFTATVHPSTAVTPLTYTWQSNDHSPITHVTGSRDDIHAFTWDVSGPQTVTLNVANAWGTVTVTHRITLTPSTPVVPGIASTAHFTHPHGLTMTLEFSAPTTDTFYLAYFPLPAIAPRAGMGYAGHAFDLKVYHDYAELPGFVFEQPVPLTLRYHDADIAPLDDEQELALYRWDAATEQWVAAACGAVQQDTAANLLTTPICGPGRFALLGRIRLLKRVEPQGMLSPGDQLTYTLIISDTPGAQFHLYDALPEELDWLGFAENPATVHYADHTVSGTLTLPASQPVTISFVTRVSSSNRRAYLTNRACIAPAGETFQLDLCHWSWPVTNTVSLPMMWRTELIESRRQFTFQDHGMRLDAKGHPHYAYGGDALYYAHFDGSAWHVTTVDLGPGTGSAASLALDSHGYPHISYYDTAHDILKYAYWDGNTWHIEIVTRTEQDVSLTGLTSLALDAQNHPYIIFFQGGFVRGMKYAHKTGGGWDIQMLSETGRTASLVLDGEGHPHIAWGGICLWGIHSDSYLSYAHWTGSEWVSENIVMDLSSSSTYNVSLQLDQNEVPHLAYTNDDQNALRYVHKENDAWVSQNIDTDGYFGAVSLTLDAENHPHIAYGAFHQEELLSTVNYVHWVNDGWESRTLTQTTSGVTGVAIAMDENQRPHLGYLAGFMLQYTHGQTWESYVVDQGGDVGAFADLAFDNEGTAYVTYNDSVNNALKLARQTGAAWTPQLADLIGETGSFSDLELDADGHPHLSYLLTAPRTLSPTLVYARWSGSEWLTQTIDVRGADVQVKTALALDSHGYPHILYYIHTDDAQHTYDWKGDELRYAYWDGATWHIEVVDQYYDLQGLDLDLDVYDRPHISYVNWEQDMYYSMRTWEGWHRLTVANKPHGLHVAIALDHHQHPHIVYGTEQGTRYTYLNTDTNTWIHEEINAEYSYGLDLVVDSSGVPHVVNQTRNGIYYMYRTRQGWSTHSPLLATNKHGYPSIALDTQGFPHLVYHSANDLNYAVGIPPAARILMPTMASR